MDINIKYDINDIADNITKDVVTRAMIAVKAEYTRLSGEMREIANNIATQINDALSIKDTRQRERVRKALTCSLDKWAKGVLKNGQ